MSAQFVLSAPLDQPTGAVPQGNADLPLCVLTFRSGPGTAALMRAVVRLHQRGADVQHLSVSPARPRGSSFRVGVRGGDAQRLARQLARDAEVQDVRVHTGPAPAVDEAVPELPAPDAVRGHWLAVVAQETLGRPVLPDDLPTEAELRAAAAALGPHLAPTPCRRSDWLSRACGREVLLKPESLQVTGSFKVRGALTHLLRAPLAGRGVVTASAGNHAQGVAYASRLLGVDCDVFTPAGAPAVKLRGAVALGARLHRWPGDVAAALTAAHAFGARSGAHLVHPYDDRHVVLGQGTVALEVLDERPDVGTLVLPAGGGGLLAGAAAAVAAVAPGVRVVGVQPSGAAALMASLDSGRPVAGPARTVADGLRVARPGALPVRWCRALVDEVLQVSDAEILAAVARLALQDHLVAEPAGAAAVAAVPLLRHLPPGPVVVVVSGGNVDGALLSAVLAGRRAVTG